VLDRGGDEVGMLDCRALEDAFQDQVVGLAAAAGEHDLARGAADQGRHPRPGGVEALARGPAGPMTRGRVAVRIRHRALDRRSDLGGDGCAGVVVEIDR
jgi:hypothetical protein